MRDLSAPPRSVADPTEAAAQPQTAAVNVGRGIAAAALLIALGNIASRMLGQARESIIAALFGTSVESSAYAIASAVPTSLYDFIVGGLVSAALVPVFSELADRDERELGHVAGTIFTVATIAMALAATGAWLLAQPLGSLLTASAGSGSRIRVETISLIRWMLPATVLMALAGLLTGLLQARRKFLLPAFSTATFNVGIILGGMLFTPMLGVRSLAAGMLIGAFGQVALQLPGLRGTRVRPNLDLRHPQVRRIGKLYIPVMIGIGFGLLGVAIDRALAAGVSDSTAATMRYATTLIQLALGIVATAISLAALPTLARQGSDPGNLYEFRRTLALSMKVLLLLLLPITMLLAALALPIASMLFAWGRAAQSAPLIATALLVYLPMLIAAGVDQPLIMAFYARRNTLLPNLVNGGAIAVYLVVALLLVRPLGVYGLILANVAQWWTHALLMLWFAHRRLDALRKQRLGEAALKGLAASSAAGVLCYGLYQELLRGTAQSKWGTLLIILGLGSLGLISYCVIAYLLELETLRVFGHALRRRLRR